ncbi:MAG: bifunctional phosphopantothenoylcysteine decarboxylase/phosphopantothenate--cysteine ligase CoaBC [Bacteroidota bacterium]
MMPRLDGKHILIGVTGGIAAYKAAYLVREFMKAGADVKVIMTEAAARFVTPLTFAALSRNPVFTDLWTVNQSSQSDISTQHIDLANWADALVIAPASANTIAKLTHGLSDNMVTVVALASPRPVVLAPAMDAEMYLNAITQKNLTVLKERGYFVLPAPSGELASGLHGPGRLPEVETIVDAVAGILDHAHQDFLEKKILVTAGPTYEAIDPVRFVGNRSSGKMGFAVARAAAQRGAEVLLIAGPVHLETPRNVERIDVESADDMLQAVKANAEKFDVVVMAAAVADFTPVKKEKNKIKKGSGAAPLDLRLYPTEDILKMLDTKKRKAVVVGFALETAHEIENAKKKLKSKNLDLIVLNAYNQKNRVFGSDINTVTLIDRKGGKTTLEKLPKFEAAHRILDAVKKFL